MASIFTQIIQGKIPSYKLYEDAKTYAFLDLDQRSRGHALVVPKLEVDKLYDLPDADFQAVMATTKKLSQHFEQVLGRRIFWKVIGTDVPHAHVHLMPYSEDYDPALANTPLEIPASEMAALQAQLQLEDA